MSDSNLVGLSYAKESSFGASVSASALKRMRFTSESLKQATSAVKSQEIRTDRQIVDIIRQNASGQGSVNWELSYAAHDDFFEYGLLADSTWTAAIDVTDTVSMVASDQSINDSGAGFGSVVVGSWIRTRGFSTAANNGFFRVVTKTNSKLTLVGTGTIVDEAAGSGKKVRVGPYIRNGTTLATVAMEKQFTDVTQGFEGYAGFGTDGLHMKFSATGIVTGTFDFMGKFETPPPTATIGNGSYTAAPTNDVMNSVDNVLYSLENMGVITITGWQFDLKNNLRQRLEVAHLGPTSLGRGTCEPTGKLTAYFSSATLFNKYLNFTVSGQAQIFQDSAGNNYVIDVPSVKYVDGQRIAGGQNQDIIADLTWNARRDPTLGYSVHISRFDNA